MKVLMSTDGSVQATTALETAARLLRKQDVQFELLCVAPEYHFAKGKPGNGAHQESRRVEAYRHQIQIEAREVLAQAQEALSREGVKAKSRVEIGSPARVISQLAGEYDLVVLGAHDKYSSSRPGLGSVAVRVVASAPNAVLIGRELPEARNWRILAAVDGSLAAERALQKMIGWLRSDSTEITLIHVIETPWIHLGLDREWFDYPTEEVDRSENRVEYGFESKLNNEARSVIEQGRAILEEQGLSANTLIAEGDPALEILSEVERGDYDIVVLGATSGADLKHTMLGSVSLKVAENSPTSVLITKEK